MSEMVERVAIAIFRNGFGELVWSAASDEQKEAAVRQATAAIVALRTPNGPMVKAGVEERDRPGSGAAVSGIWYAMIDEALK